ncbi:hypothetical protein EUZ85_23310 [Hahella sp. KA22]|uniref:hypothetical protein n=1 Tax=Hahella sp. KA22 TaxID=1628392 RepID=UPI000FDCE422|nr:hypothetical protein [Hahella sp. KA22]AZZ93490.1 hypothetical protein ENC22_20730 [Hahella sp. KA22]QAY56864.1 hypothetical protein EUZ85_23310 [Hahella sp. KA22]
MIPKSGVALGAFPKVEFFIGGGGDKGDWITNVTRATGIMGDVRDYREGSSSGITCYYYGHEDQDLVLSMIKGNWRSGAFKSIRLTGHSWGGQVVMDLTQDLFHASIPVDELITLDPVSMFPFSKVIAGKWVNVYCKQSIMDNTIGAVPVIGNAVSALTSWVGQAGEDTNSSDYIANVGGQLGSENGAHNIEMNVTHADAMHMYKKARAEMTNAPLNPKAIGIR